ncbi:energy-coupling factor transporter transmembrane component T family protein [Arenibacterium sp. LLYu02]|uniref:energy-coupling factor transporter transmembrane component T family protein n=1 Tax=Arenibacterium sp. LLYu02 TaxID=3404132 RepID=UPI003B20E17B
MLDLYAPGASWLHRLSPAYKVLGLFMAGTLLFAVDRIEVLAALSLLTVILYFCAGLGLRHMSRQLRPALWVFVLIFAAQALFNSWGLGLFVVLRLVVLILLAGLLSLTTRASEIIAGIEAGLIPLRRFGLPTEKISLAISLALRFIPVLATVVTEVREAQKTRGLERNLLALAIPVIVRTLRMSEDISDAIDARGF